MTLPLMILGGLLTAITACGGDTTTEDSGVTDTDSDADTDADSDTDTDSDRDADTDTDTDTDADTDADTDTDTDADKFLGHIVEPAGTTSSTAPVSVDVIGINVGGEGLDVNDSWATGVVNKDGSFAVSLPTPTDDDLVEIDPEGLPGLKLLITTGVVFEDGDGDGTYDDGEVFLGSNMARWPTFIGGVVPKGWPEGWALVDAHVFDDNDNDPDFYDITDDVEVTLTGLVVDAITIGGSWESTKNTGGPPGPSPKAERLSLIPLDADFQPDYDAPIADGELAASWTLELAGQPGELYELADESDDGFELWGVYGLGLVYVDTNENGELDIGGPGSDSPTGATMCSASGAPVLAGYLAQPTTATAGITAALFGFNAGWLVMEVGGEDGEGKPGPAAKGGEDGGPPVVLDASGYGALAITKDCTL